MSQDTNGDPAVSIVIPSFGRNELLLECLASIQGQTLDNWECIIVDDGHADGIEMGEIVESLGDSRVVVLRHPTNRGMGAARNTAIREARSNFVLPVDTDDRLAPTFLERTSKVLLAAPSVDCVVTDFLVFGGSERIQTWSPNEMAHMAVEQWLPGPGVLMRKSLWERVGGYCEDPDLRGDDDWDFWIGAAEQGFTALHIPEPLYLYRDWSGSYTATTLSSVQYLTRSRIYARHRAFFDRHGEGPRFRANGYLHSSLDASTQGDRVHALRLALSGWRLRPSDMRLPRAAARAVLSVRARERIKRYVDRRL